MLQTLYKRAACTEEFFDLVNTAHVENGHIGLSQTYAAVSVKFGSLCVSVCVRMSSVCVCVCVCKYMFQLCSSSDLFFFFSF